MNGIATRPAQDTAATVERNRGAQEDFDCQAMEWCENEAMIVHQGLTLNLYDNKDLNAITTR